MDRLTEIHVEALRLALATSRQITICGRDVTRAAHQLWGQRMLNRL